MFWPQAIDRTRLDIIWFAADWGEGEQPEEHRAIWAQRLTRFDTVMDEDYENLAPIQRSMESAAHGGQAINYQERRIWHVQAWIDKVIGPERIPRLCRSRTCWRPGSSTRDRTRSGRRPVRRQACGPAGGLGRRVGLGRRRHRRRKWRRGHDRRGGGGESWRLGHRPRAQRVHRWHHREVRRGPVDPEQLADASGLVDDRADAPAISHGRPTTRATTQSTRPSGSPPTSTLLETFYDTGSVAIEELIAVGALTLEAVDYPDYYADLPEDTAQRPRRPARVPTGVATRHRPHRRPAPRGPARAAAERLGATVLLEHRAAHVVRNDQLEVIGLEVQVGRAPSSSAPGAAFFCSVVSSTTSGSRWSSCAAL